MRTEDRVDMDRSIGELIHGLMWRRRVSQVSLAPAIGIDNSALARKLRGERAWTSSDLVNVARELRVSFVLTESGCAIRDSNPEPADSVLRWRRPRPRAHMSLAGATTGRHLRRVV